MNILIRDDHVSALDGVTPKRSTFGTQGKDGRFGGAYPDGRANLCSWVDKGEGGQELINRNVKCRSYRRAVRVLRWHLMGYGV